MSVEPIEKISRRILAQYDKNPKNWTVLADRRNNLLVLGPDGGFRLKVLPLGPNRQLGVGAEVDISTDLQEIMNESSSYGFRPLSMEKARGLLTAIQQGNLERGHLKNLLGVSPVSTADLQKMRPEMILSGPVMLHPNLSTISDGQKELEKKLRIEADKLFRKKYPLRAGIYR